MEQHTEHTPLLDSEAAIPPTDSETASLKCGPNYQRFTPARKRVIVALSAWAAVIPMLASSSFVPSIPQIARDLGTTGEVISLAVSLALVSGSAGSLLWATYSGSYGRRTIYLLSLPLLCLGSAGVATSKSVPTLMFWRVVQSLGASSGMAVGCGAIADVYKSEERGTAMGIFFAASLFGPAIAPLCGGVATHYFSWRYGQWGLFVLGLLVLIPVYFCLPETLDPEKRRRWGATEESKKPIFLNPFKSLGLLRSPNMVVVALVGTTAMVTNFVLMIPLAYTIGKQYNITNEAIIGAFFLPSGLGNMVGASLAGRMSDRMVVKWRKRRGPDVWVPEDRLRACLWGAGVFVPLSVLLSGLTTQFVPGTLGIVLNLVWLFMNSIGINIVLTPSQSYYIDIWHSRSAETTAASGTFRGVIIASVTAGILPLINAIGVAATGAIFAGVAWIGFGLTFFTIKYGDRMRASVDVGYSTARDN
ncbi:MFS general substrate transporter [Trametes versicolor FP-101664 SS1]|uniref:MFS general substrate transporter n=1 Tax=Trametes versicolor (strain FP-101664) TaxID=717944 RepID=UPI0004621942|nr:MFS general substrate transporter [Trametes versicolor FP-101664 SS1]EIW61025.1 MFS general substrate transporter [Trametes versicolor FP-101664 SS1]